MAGVPNDGLAGGGLEEAMNRLWAQFLPQIHERVDVLAKAAGSVAAGTLSDEQREETQSAAHKLAGSLGMYGHDDGTRLARQLEMLLDYPTPDPAQIRTLATQLRSSLFPEA